MDAAWHRALGFALTGTDVALGVQSSPDPAHLAAQLAEAGWPAERIADHARAIQASGGIWPHPIPDALRAGLGAAQLSAALGAARRALGLAALESRVAAPRSVLTADERRLLADAPPHHLPR